MRTQENQMLHLYNSITQRTRCFIYIHIYNRETDASSKNKHENQMLHLKINTRTQRTRCFICKCTTREHREPDAINIHNKKNHMLHLKIYNTRTQSTRSSFIYYILTEEQAKPIKCVRGGGLAYKQNLILRYLSRNIIL